MLVLLLLDGLALEKMQKDLSKSGIPILVRRRNLFTILILVFDKIFSLSHILTSLIRAKEIDTFL